MKTKHSLLYAFYLAGLVLILLPGCTPPAEKPELTPPSTDMRMCGYLAQDNVSLASSSGYYYIAGQNTDGEAILLEINLADGKKYTVQMDDSFTPFTPYPDSFETNGSRYLLFGKGLGDFRLYKLDSYDEEREVVLFRSSSEYDYSAISPFVRQKSLDYQGDENYAWILCPVFSAERETLYFTLCFWEENAVKGDYIKTRVYESPLNGNSFEAPAEARGVIDPYDPSHYTNGLRHDQDDFPGRMGIFWIGRMYVTDDGNKAFFTSMNISAGDTCGILKADCPYIAPFPNSQNCPGYDLYGPQIIHTFILEADIEPDGSFSNLRQLPSYINRGGASFVFDISSDGNILYVGHMVIDHDFWNSGYGPDGMVLALAQKAPWDVEPWNGIIEKIDLVNATIEPFIYQ